MVDLDILKARKITAENLEKWLSGDPLGKLTEKSVRPGVYGDPEKDKQELSDHEKRMVLLRRIRSRVQEGMDRNYSDYRHYYVLDKAWETPFRQITPTLLSTFMDTNPNSEDVWKAVQSWGLEQLVVSKPDPNKPGGVIKSFNFPTFFNVMVPLVKSYVTIRWAKIVNDRRLTPFFEFAAAKITNEMMVKCGVITDRIHVTAMQYGYFDVMKQAVLKMLHYSTCFQFPKEEWHSEEQVRYATEEDVAMGKKKPDPTDSENKEGVPVAVGDEITVTVKEGLRYHLPHPTRTYYDIAHGPYTFNYDCGCEYSGYWQIVRYRDIVNSNFWNQDKIALGSVDLTSTHSLFFQTVYSACTLKLPCATNPEIPSGAAGAAGMGLGTGPLDRERAVGSLYYGTEYLDQGVLVTHHFEKLIPKDNGLGDYEHPVWFRFVLAGDGCTVLYACPIPYNPTIYYGYDADESRLKNASLSLEVLPYQDQFSNVLTQIILTAKQNLANLTMIDEDQLTDAAKKDINNIGEAYYRFLNVFGYSGKKAFRGQNRVSDVAQSVNFPKGNVAELINVLKTILDVLERVLVMSSQEVAQAASHEQTREEIKNINASTSSRLVFTAIPVDIATEAWKRQLYQAHMAYGDDDMYVHLPSDIPLDQAMLTAMGFTFTDKDTWAKGQADKVKYVRAKISKKKTAIDLWQLASTREGNDRIDKEKIGVTMSVLVEKLLANPMTAAAIGPDQAIDLANQICKLMNIPRDFKLKNMSQQASPEQQQADAQAQLKQVTDTVLQTVGQQLQPLMEEVKRNSTDIALVMQTLNIQTPTPNDSNSTEVAVGAPS